MTRREMAKLAALSVLGGMVPAGAQAAAPAPRFSFMLWALGKLGSFD